MCKTGKPSKRNNRRKKVRMEIISKKKKKSKGRDRWKSCSLGTRCFCTYTCFLPAQLHPLGQWPPWEAVCISLCTGSWMDSLLTERAWTLFCPHAPKKENVSHIYTYLLLVAHKYFPLAQCLWSIPSNPLAHLQPVAVVWSGHNDFFIIEENIGVSFKADGWGGVNFLSLP